MKFFYHLILCSLSHLFCIYFPLFAFFYLDRFFSLLFFPCSICRFVLWWLLFQWLQVLHYFTLRTLAFDLREVGSIVGFGDEK